MSSALACRVESINILHSMCRDSQSYLIALNKTVMELFSCYSVYFVPVVTRNTGLERSIPHDTPLHTVDTVPSCNTKYFITLL